MTTENPKRIALISMCEGAVTPGLRLLEGLAKDYGTLIGVQDIRIGDKLPDFNDFDLLLSSGGPGDPRELGNWGQAYADLITRIRDHNRTNPAEAKGAFLICHSFQVMSYYWGLGDLSRRDQPLWGIAAQIPQTVPAETYPVFPTEPFHALESRFYQVMPSANLTKACADHGIVITAKDEKGALTAWQTIDGHIAATQFHPEAIRDNVEKLLDNPSTSPANPMSVCDPAMITNTRDNLHLLDVMRDLIIRFINRDT